MWPTTHFFYNLHNLRPSHLSDSQSSLLINCLHLQLLQQQQRRSRVRSVQRIIVCTNVMPSRQSPRERADFVKSSRLCFNCLSSKHHAKQCKSTTRCRANGCGKPHHTLLHYEKKEENVHSSTPQTTNEVPKANFCVSAKVNSQEVLVQVLPLRVTSMTGNTITTYSLQTRVRT